MSIQRTLSIIKPDAVASGYIGEVYSRIEAAGLRIIAAKMLRLSEAQVSAFYAVHREAGFFDSLVAFMLSGPVMVQVLEGEGAVGVYRDLMGHTNPQMAQPGTMRADLAVSIDANAVHGSDSVETAQEEVRFFFPDMAFVGVRCAPPSAPRFLRQ